MVDWTYMVFAYLLVAKLTAFNFFFFKPKILRKRKEGKKPQI